MSDKRTRIPTLYLVIPCYNEEEVIEKTASVVKDKMERLVNEGRIAHDSKALFVNDGSKDNTLSMLHKLAHEDTFYGVLSFAGNYGHQSAILAGMLLPASATAQEDSEELGGLFGKNGFLGSRGTGLFEISEQEGEEEGKKEKQTETDQR